MSAGKGRNRVLLRHKANDIPVALSKAHEAAEVNYGDNLFDHVKDLNRRTQAILAQAEVSGASERRLPPSENAGEILNCWPRCLWQPRQAKTLHGVRRGSQRIWRDA